MSAPVPRRTRDHPALQVLLALVVAALPISGVLLGWLQVSFQIEGSASRADYLSGATSLGAAALLTVLVGPPVVAAYGVTRALHAAWLVPALLAGLGALDYASAGRAIPRESLDLPWSVTESAFGAVVLPTTWPGVALGVAAVVVLLRGWSRRGRPAPRAR